MQLIKSALSGLFGAIIFGSQAIQAEYTDTDVKILSADNFDAFVKEQEATLVKFYAPWCGHCNRLEPEYINAAKALKSDNITIATLDCTQNEDFCSKRQIRGYPTLKVFKSGNEFDYEVPRDAAGIIKFMKRQLLPAVSTVEGDQLKGFIEGDEIVVMTVVSAKDKVPEYFNKLAEKHRNEYTFGALIASPKILGTNYADNSTFGPIGEGDIVMFKKFDEKFARFSGTADEATVGKWVLTESTPLMAEIGPENYAKYMQSGLPMAYLFYGDDAQRQEYGAIVEEVMRPYKGQINAIYINAKKFDRHAEALALPKEWPGFVIHEIENDLKFPLHKTLNKANLAEFVKAFQENKLEPEYRSDPVPDNNDGDLKVVVFKTWEQIVMDPKKDVLIELYAPWCGACKRLAPIYEELAKAYGPHSDKVVIAKMDATTNDIPKDAGIKLTKFPTVLLFSAGAKTPIELDKPAVDVQSFVDFIKEHSTNKVEVTLPEQKAGQVEKDEL